MIYYFDINFQIKSKKFILEYVFSAHSTNHTSSDNVTIYNYIENYK